MTARRQTKYTKEQIARYLSWIARGMKQHRQSVFQLERMQPSWMIDPKAQRSYIRRSRVLGVLIVASCIAAIQITWELYRSAILPGIVLALAMGAVAGWALARHERARLAKSGIPQLFVIVFGALLLVPLFYVVQVVASLPLTLQNGVMSVMFFVFGLVPGVLFALPGGAAYGLFGRLLFGMIGGAIGGLAITLLVVRLLLALSGSAADSAMEAFEGQVWSLYTEDFLVFGLLGGLIGGVTSLAWKNREPEWSKRPFVKYTASLAGLVAIPGVALALLPVYLEPLQSYFLNINGIEYQFMLDDKARFISFVITIALVVGFIWGRRASGRNLSNDIQLLGRLRWSLQGSALGLFWGLIVGIGAGFIIGAAQENFLQSFWVIAVLCGVGGLVTRGLKAEIPEHKTHPNEGRHLAWGTARYVALFVGIAAALIYGLIILGWRTTYGIEVSWNVLLSEACLFGLGIGVLAGLWHGGLDVVYQTVLFGRLRKHDYIPRDLVKFLDLVTDKFGFLHRRGGGYVFEDRDLLEYFAKASDKEFSEELQSAQAARSSPPAVALWASRTAFVMLILAAGLIVYQSASSSLGLAALEYDWQDCSAREATTCSTASGSPPLEPGRNYEFRLDAPGLAEASPKPFFDPFDPSPNSNFYWSADYYYDAFEAIDSSVVTLDICREDQGDAFPDADDVVCQSVNSSLPGEVWLDVSLPGTLPERALQRRLYFDFPRSSYDALVAGLAAGTLSSLRKRRAALESFIADAGDKSEEFQERAWWSYPELNFRETLADAQDQLAEITSQPELSHPQREYPGDVLVQSDGIEFCAQGEELEGDTVTDVTCDVEQPAVCDYDEVGLEVCVPQYQTCGSNWSPAIQFLWRSDGVHTRFVYDVAPSDDATFPFSPPNRAAPVDGQWPSPGQDPVAHQYLQHTGTHFGARRLPPPEEIATNPALAGLDIPPTGSWVFRVFVDDDSDDANNRQLLHSRAFRIVDC